MRVLVCEFVTGGGMRGLDLPPSLAREGAMMRDALLRDLSELPGVEAVATADDRLAAPTCGEIHAVRERDDIWKAWASLARGCDAAWPIAPETGGVLARLAKLLGETGVDVIGPGEEAIAVASSKILTARRLRESGIPTPLVWRAGETPADAGPVVVKPDDGAGCDATLLFDRPPSDVPAGSIVQPFVSGEAASLTVLRAHGTTRMLAANRQHVAIEGGAFRFRGLTVGAIEDTDGKLAALARAVGDALPGLDGIFGIDLVLSTDGPVVIEINPRLTTAYCGLRESLGLNPVSLVPPFDVAPASAWAGARPVEVAL